MFSWKYNLPWASKNSSSELSSESRAMLCILHSEMLWRDGLTVKPQEAKWSLLIGDMCFFSLSLFFLNTYRNTLQQGNVAQAHALQAQAQTQCYINTLRVSMVCCCPADEMGCMVVRGDVRKVRPSAGETPKTEGGEHLESALSVTSL